MSNKKWFFITVSMSALFYLVALIIYIIVDAEMVFDNSVTNKKFGYTQYYSKHQFDKLKNNQYSLIFGTSQSQKLSSRMLNQNILNINNIYGEPAGILNFLSQLNEKQIKNIKHIYYLVSPRTMRDESTKINYKSNSYIDKLTHILPLSSLSIKDTIRDLKYNFLKSSVYYHVDNDGSVYINNKNQSSILNKRKADESYIDSISKTKSIEVLLKLNKFCKDNNMDLIFDQIIEEAANE